MESNVKRIISETSKICRERGHQVDSLIVAYLASLGEVQKAWESVCPGATLQTDLDADAVLKLSGVLAELVVMDTHPLVQTAKLQVRGNGYAKSLFAGLLFNSAIGKCTPANPSVAYHATNRSRSTCKARLRLYARQPTLQQVAIVVMPRC